MSSIPAVVQVQPQRVPQMFLPPHIIVLVHGNNGAPTDFDAIEACLVKKYGTDQVLIIKSEANHMRTSMGVKAGGARLAVEVYEKVFNYELSPEVNTYKFSIIAHSLGGLYARFALVQIMESLSPLDIQYVSFVTLCTPHLGSRRPRGDSKLKNVWRMGVHTVLATNSLYGQTGVDLLLESSGDDEYGSPLPPILETMANPEFEYLKALKQFRFGTLVAVTDGDVIVPYASASIRNFNPYPSTFLTERFTDWRWHVYHSGFTTTTTTTTMTTAAEGDDAETITFLKKLEDRMGQTKELADLHAGVDVSCCTCERFQSADGYDCDNKEEVEFPYAMIHALQQAIPWRRIDVTIEPFGVKGKLRLHDWGINKMQPPGCRAHEFIDLLCDMVGNDHNLELLPDAPDEELRLSSDAATATMVDGPDDEAPRLPFVGPINRLLDKIQKKGDTATTTPSVSSDSQLSSEDAGIDEEPPRTSFFGAGINRMREKFQKKDPVILSPPSEVPNGAPPASPFPGSSSIEADDEPRNSFGAMGFRFMEKFKKQDASTPSTTTTVGAPSVSTESFTTETFSMAGNT